MKRKWSVLCTSRGEGGWIDLISKYRISVRMQMIHSRSTSRPAFLLFLNDADSMVCNISASVLPHLSSTAYSGCKWCCCVTNNFIQTFQWRSTPDRPQYSYCTTCTRVFVTGFGFVAYNRPPPCAYSALTVLAIQSPFGIVIPWSTDWDFYSVTIIIFVSLVSWFCWNLSLGEFRICHNRRPGIASSRLNYY